MTTTDDTLLLCHATGCGAQQDHGLAVCRRHADEAGQQLARIGDLYARLDAVPSFQGREPNTGGASGLAAHRSVGSMDVMVLRDRRSSPRREDDLDGNTGRGVFEVLNTWAGGVREERGLRHPTRRLPVMRVCGGAEGPVCAIWCNHDTCKAGTMRGKTHVPLTVATERKLLSDHLDWILAQTAAGQFCDDLRTVWTQVRGLVEGRPARRTVPCPACGVPARWTDGAIGCGACGTTTQGLELLKKRQEAAA